MACQELELASQLHRTLYNWVVASMGDLKLAGRVRGVLGKQTVTSMSGLGQIGSAEIIHSVDQSVSFFRGTK